MHQSKLLKLLKAMTHPEWKAFGKFLNSPYHHSGKRLLSLYYFLDKYFPKFDSPKIHKEAIFYKIYPEGKSYDHKIMASLMSAFKSLVEDFLIIHAVRENSFLKKKILASELRKRNLSGFYKYLINNMLGQLRAEPFKTYKNYMDQFLIENDLYYFPTTDKFNAKVCGLENAMKNLDDFYFTSKLRLACEFESRSKFFSENTSIKLLKEVSEIAALELKENNPAVSLYLSFLNLFNSKTEEQFAFSEAEKNFLNFFPELSKDEQMELLPLLLNFANHCAMKGKVEFLDRQFELYKLGLASGLLVENGIMPDSIFTNIVMIGAAKKSFSWTEDFIQNYQEYVEADIRKVAVTLCWARLAFSKQEFEKAYQLLNEIHKSNSKYQMRIKSLYLRCLFEFYLKEDHYFDVLIAGIAAFEKYLCRNKIFSEIRKQVYKHFCKLLKKLVFIKDESRSSEKAKYIAEWEAVYSNTPQLIHKKWLLQKLDELKNKARGF